VVVVAYHTTGPFTNTYATTRYGWYGGGGTPNVKLDGSFQVVGGLGTGTMYPVYRDYFDTRRSVASPLEIALSANYDSVSRQGTGRIVLNNTSGSPVSGQLQVVLTEHGIYYPWSGGDSLYSVARLMLPDAGGEAVTIPASDSLVKTRNFTINSAWTDYQCELVAFVQNNSTREILQGGRCAIRPRPRLAYLGYSVTLPHPRPGQENNLSVQIRNSGLGAAQGVSAVLTTSDPNVTIVTGSASYGDIARGATALPGAPFQIRVGGGCPDPHLAVMNLAITAAGGYSRQSTFPINIASDGMLYDDMENGINGWTHSGTRDQWHQTTHRNQSPTHSWYCGTEGSWLYTNENDASLVTPYFTVGNNDRFLFQHLHATEQDYDYCLVELNNGSEFWQPMASYTGSSSGWELAQFVLSDYVGQTLRVRFRFLSDYNVTGEGWYIDDFIGGGMIAVAEPPVMPRHGAVHATVRSLLLPGQAGFDYALPPGVIGRLEVLDASGRLIARFDRLAGSDQVAWDLKDFAGRPVASGCYFARLVSADGSDRAKFSVLR
jgi:hypothetical protein